MSNQQKSSLAKDYARLNVLGSFQCQSFELPITLKGERQTLKALIDSGATHSFIHQKVVDKHKLPTKPLPQPIYLLNADGTHNSHGKVSRKYQADLTIEAGWRGELPLLVTELNDGEVVLGADWLVKANPIIDWKNLTITYPSNLRLMKEAPLVPPQYHEYLDVFSEEEAMRMPKRKKWDMSGVQPTTYWYQGFSG